MLKGFLYGETKVAFGALRVKLVHLGLAGEIEILSPNVALNGTATQSSNFHHPAYFSDPDQALYANDGNFSTDVHGLRARCAITNADLGAWWQVDLMSYHVIQKVAVTTRKAAGTISGLIN